MSPVFPNTTNTRTWPYGTVKPVEVVEVIAKPGARVAAIVCRETFSEAGQWFILELRPALLPTTGPGDTGEIIYRRGGPTLGFWDYVPLLTAHRPPTVVKFSPRCPLCFSLEVRPRFATGCVSWMHCELCQADFDVLDSLVESGPNPKPETRNPKPLPT